MDLGPRTYIRLIALLDKKPNKPEKKQIHNWSEHSRSEKSKSQKAVMAERVNTARRIQKTNPDLDWQTCMSYAARELKGISHLNNDNEYMKNIEEPEPEPPKNPVCVYCGKEVEEPESDTCRTCSKYKSSLKEGVKKNQ